MIAAIIPAGGHSTRMGRPKLVLPLGGRAVIEHVVAALLAGGADRVLVVVGPHVPELVSLAESAGAETLRLPGPTADMRETVEHGLQWVELRLRPRLEDAFLLCPGDYPTVGAEVVRQVCKAPASPIAVPVAAGRRGHPVRVAWGLVPELFAFPSGQGINAFLRTKARATLEIPVAGDAFLNDLDAPEDYRRVSAAWDPR